MAPILAALKVQAVLLSRSPFFLAVSLAAPIAFSSIVLVMSREATESDRVALVLGSGLLGAWSAVLFGAGESLVMQRFTGTLAVIVGSPAGILRPLVGFSLATVLLGCYSIAAVLVWSAVLFRVIPTGVPLAAVAGTLAACLVALTAMSLVLACWYLLSRQGITVSNALEYPIWLVSGVLVPASALAPPLEVIGRLLPLGWAVSALRSAIAGEAFVTDAVIALAMSAVFAAGGLLLLRVVMHRARVTGEIELR